HAPVVRVLQLQIDAAVLRRTVDSPRAIVLLFRHVWLFQLQATIVRALNAESVLRRYAFVRGREQLVVSRLLRAVSPDQVPRVVPRATQSTALTRAPGQ